MDSKSPAPRQFAIGDIHGCHTALNGLLEAMQPQSQDEVITLGDYLNKGPNAKAVLETLIALQEQVQLISLRGNHELYLLTAAKYGRAKLNGKDLLDRHTLLSYSPSHKPGTLKDIPAAHWQFVRETCVDWWETDRHLFVHATVAPHRPLAKQTKKALFWDKFRHPAPHQSGKPWICGHTPQKNGKPLNLGHAICIDTWVYGKGWLTGLEVNSGQVWQANQQGDLRTAHIEEFFVDPSRPS